MTGGGLLPVDAVEVVVDVATVVVDTGLDPGQILSSITQTLRYSGLLPPTDPVPHGAMENSKSVPFQVAKTPHPQSTVLQVCSTEVDEFPPYLNQMIFGLKHLRRSSHLKHNPMAS